MSKEVNKFILEGEEIEFSDTKAREDITSLDTKIDNEVGRLETEINGKATIDDSDITTNKTWSSGQIFAEDNATREITATLNLTNRAEQNYNAGDLLTYNSKLYKVISSISQGDLLTPGTNIQLSKVSTELKGLENTCDNLQAQINNKATIDDSDITTSKTWSSSKILAEDVSIRENIATFNLTDRAEQNYDVGDLIEWNYKLCKVIAPISQGDLLELGVNINRTTVATELNQGSGSEIDDQAISTQKTWSSSKINTQDQISLDMISKFEEGSVSQGNYTNTAEFIRHLDKLYINTNPIAIGEALVENVNIKEETIGHVLTLLTKNSIRFKQIVNGSSNQTITFVSPFSGDGFGILTSHYRGGADNVDGIIFFKVIGVNSLVIINKIGATDITDLTINNDIITFTGKYYTTYNLIGFRNVSI